MRKISAITMHIKSPPTAARAIAKVIEDVNAIALVSGLLRRLCRVLEHR